MVAVVVAERGEGWAGGGGAYSFAARLSHLTIDHAFETEGDGEGVVAVVVVVEAEIGGGSGWDWW